LIGRPARAFSEMSHGKDDLLTAMFQQCNPYYLVVCVYLCNYE
jgi:hypothetical protein